tara:strand:- start:662 stop:808 length:147 start_codon:yes stop_codon:yes gene_type:complete
MKKNIYWFKYLSPFIGILFCPVTILFLWSFWSEPVINPENEIIKAVKP